MSGAEQAKRELAASASTEQIAQLLHDSSPRVISALLENRNLSEDDILVIATRKNLPPEIFKAIARDQRWAKSQPLRLALASNPKTPLSVSLSIARYLRLFDLAALSRSPHIQYALRNKIEALLAERIPTMELGLKKTLAKTAVGNTLLKLLQTHDAQVVALCLNNPRLLESHLYKIISRKDTTAETIRMIAVHANWSLRPAVRFALIRNEHTPLLLTSRFLQTMTLLHLRDLYEDPSLPVTVKPLVYREVLSRGRNPSHLSRVIIYEIGEGDDNELDNFRDERWKETDNV
ncbi:MAG TPA: hypothetical protein VK654_01805 [Nitrospirota bacterium]|nr:hypothetical protein [Nitrospirota bacterium]